MPQGKLPRRPIRDAGALTIEELEAGLRMLNARAIDRNGFWEDNLDAFRRTVLFAIRDTSDALLSPRITRRWRLELKGQLLDLLEYLELADHQLARRSLSPEGPVQVLAPARRRTH
jgi:hypothetical protein